MTGREVMEKMRQLGLQKDRLQADQPGYQRSSEAKHELPLGQTGFSRPSEVRDRRVR